MKSKKDFRQRRKPRPGDPPEKIKGGWVWSVKDVRHVPYRLPDVLEVGDRVMLIVEGEKDVDKLWAWVFRRQPILAALASGTPS